MNILILSTDDHLGAGKAAYRMLEALSSDGVTVRMLVCNKQSRDDRVVVYKRSLRTRLKALVKRLLNGKNPARTKSFQPEKQYYFFGTSEYEPVFGIHDVESLFSEKIDLIIFTWINRFLTAANLMEMKKRTGAVFLAYPLDMSLFTGGCHYSWGCTGYQSACTPCPAIQQPAFKNVAADILARKRNAYQAIGVKWLAASSGLQRQIASSPLAKGQDVALVGLPIDQTIFNNRKRQPREELPGSRESRRIILFGAAVASETRKGFAHFMAALKMMAQPDTAPTLPPVKIRLMGHADSSTAIDIPGFEVEYVGYVNGDTRLADLYQSADVFVNCSLEDSGPMMLNEAVLCGCVTVAYDTGVAPDVIVDGTTGFLVTIGDIQTLADRIHQLITAPSDRLNQMSLAASEHAARLYSYDLFRSRIRELV